MQTLPVWNAVKEQVRHRLGEKTHKSWTSRLELIDVTESAIILGAPNGFARDRIESDFGRIISECWNTHDPRSVRFTIGDAPKQSAPSGPVTDEDALLADFAAAGTSTAAALSSDKFTFENFVVGPCNELAHAVARRIATSKETQYNPVVFHGAHGMGKTHLLQAIRHRITTTQSGRKVKFLSSEAFVSGFVSSLRGPGRDGVNAFKDELRAVDVLIIDDAHFVADKQASQEELLHTLIALMEDGKQVILATDCHPHQIPKATERLKSHLCGGLLCDIGPADFALRRRILDKLVTSKHSEGKEVIIPAEARDHLAARINASPRDLIGAFNQVTARADFLGVPLTLENVQNALTHSRYNGATRPTVDRIQKTVVQYYGIDMDDMLSASRRRNLARPRQIAMFLSKQLTTRSLPDIGRRFRRDHTTVLHAARKIPELRQTDDQIDLDIQAIEKMLKS